jgi:thioredoxin domain-containing protein 5
MLEPTQDALQGTMNAPQELPVVIAAVTGANMEKLAERFMDVGMKWRVRTGGTGKVGGKEQGREVMSTWVDEYRLCSFGERGCW